MRILHVCIGGEVAGGQVVALQLAHAARNRGDWVELVVPGRGPFSERAESEGFPVHVLDLNRTYRVGAAARLAQLAGRFDLLHTHTLAAANVLSRIAGRAVRVPVLAHLHIENHFRRPTEPVLRRLDRSTARLCARLVAVSEDTRRAYERQGYPRGRIEVVYNGVEPSETRSNGSLRAELGLADSVPLIGEVGRLCDVKGQRELIAALASLPDAALVLVGKDLEEGGAYQARLEREAERLGVRDRVVFAGYRDDARVLVRELDVLALPSWTEGLPLVVLEAMAERRPVVATPVGGTPELVADGETGILVPPREPAALAEALGRLLADTELRRRMGEAGERRVRERFTAEAMTTRMLELYDEAAG
jgi:glycosyltransferase involved in cell wall biosynthesis